LSWGAYNSIVNTQTEEVCGHSSTYSSVLTQNQRGTVRVAYMYMQSSLVMHAFCTHGPHVA